MNPQPSAWDHAALIIGSVLAIAIGAFDLFLAGQHMTVLGDVGFMGAGLTALGVKGITGNLPPAPQINADQYPTGPKA